ncbi:MAG: hypothetical protein KIT58_03130 [Planctomycetota bacterium]|nr:hypothetical protein [Planctomycetota bacterium]
MAGTVTTDALEIRAAEPFGDPKVDRAAGIVRGVKILGARSKNRVRGLPSRYDEGALDKAAPLYEGAPVYLDHPANRDPHAERSYRDRFGRLESVRREADGLFGDLRVNPEHPRARQFLWDAEHNSTGMGLSHNARLTGAVRGGEYVYESIDRVRSVDVVTEPATTQGLFESCDMEARMSTPASTSAPSSGAGQPPQTPSENPPWAGRPFGTTASPAAPPLAGSSSAATESARVPSGSQPPSALDALDQRIAARFEERLAKLEQEKDALAVQLAGRERREQVESLIEQARLPAHAVTDVFRRQVLEAKDDEAVKALIEDRRRIAWHQTPSAPPPAGSGAPITDRRQFVAELKAMSQGGR